MFGSHSLGAMIAEAAIYLAILLAALATYQVYLNKRQIAPPAGPTPELTEATEALKESQETIELACQAANDGLWFWDRFADTASFSPRWKELLGYDSDDIGDSTAEWFSRIHPADVERVHAELYTHLCGESSHFESRHRLLHADGTYHWVLTRGMALRDETGTVSRIGGSLSDMSALVDAQHRLVREAMHDELTGLPNRAYFMEVLERATARCHRREDYRFAVLFMDLDRFKTVNDTLGHGIGDELLVSVARRLEACIRPGDVVARLGGDEFTLLLDDIEEPADPTRVTGRIIDAMNRPVRIGTHEVISGASVGIVLSEPGSTPDELMRAADLAMYRAKSRGRGRYEVFDRHMHAETVARMKLETELRAAVDRREFQLFYQPVVDAPSRWIRGFEVLMRWNHPERGVVPADEFISVANDTGLILPLGTWMLREACFQTARWQKMFPQKPPLTVGVNFCRKEMLSPTLLSRVEQLLNESGLEPATLSVEISEGGMLDNSDESLKVFEELSRAGVRFQIDDFGAGVSSLSYLHRFPVDSVKIDRSFIEAIATDSGSRDIVKSIVALANSMEVQVVAAGVETEEQESELIGLGCCSLVQGYRYSPPVTSIEAEALLQLQYSRARLRAS